MAASLRTILCPMDLEERSYGKVLPLLGALARRHSAALILLHVVPTQEFRLLRDVYRSTEGGGANAEWAEQVARETLARIADQRLSGIRTEVRTQRSGNLPQAVLAAAGECSADLIAIGLPERAGVGKLLFGSLAEKLMRAAPASVLSVPPRYGEAHPTFRKVLALIELDHESARVADCARSLCAEDGSIVLLHVVPTGQIYLRLADAYREAREDVSEGGDVSVVRAERVAREQLEALARERLAGTRTEVLTENSDDPGRTILEVAGDVQADLLVLPTEGFTGFFRMVMGNVAERVAYESTRPVVTLLKRPA